MRKQPLGLDYQGRHPDAEVRDPVNEMGHKVLNILSAILLVASVVALVFDLLPNG